MALGCALALPAAQAQAQTTVDPANPTVEQPEPPTAGEAPAPEAAPAVQETAPAAESVSVPGEGVPAAEGVPVPGEGAPAAEGVAAPGEADRAPADAAPAVTSAPSAPAMEPDGARETTAEQNVSIEVPSPAPDRGLVAPAASSPLSRVRTLLRRVDERVTHVKSELHAGHTPPNETLRALREDVEALPPAVRTLERDVVPRLDFPGVHRALRRVLARTGPLVQALARSGVDTAEVRRLARALAGLTRLVTDEAGTPAGTIPNAPEPRAARDRAAKGTSPENRTAPRPESYPTAERARAPLAYTRTAAASAPEASIVVHPRTLLHAATPDAARTISTLDLAAVALLVALALSASLSCLLVKAGLPVD